MLRSGFDCSIVKGGGFSEYKVDFAVPVDHPVADYLFCDKTTWQIPVLMGTRYQIALVFSNAVVTDYYVSISGQGI